MVLEHASTRMWTMAIECSGVAGSWEVLWHGSGDFVAKLWNVQHECYTVLHGD